MLRPAARRLLVPTVVSWPLLVSEITPISEAHAAPPLPADVRGACGVWRWDVKTLSDPDRTSVNFTPQQVDRLSPGDRRWWRRGRRQLLAVLPDFCIPPRPPDLDCADVAPHVNFTVLPSDPRGFDGNDDGVGCETQSKVVAGAD